MLKNMDGLLAKHFEENDNFSTHLENDSLLCARADISSPSLNGSLAASFRLPEQTLEETSHVLHRLLEQLAASTLETI